MIWNGESNPLKAHATVDRRRGAEGGAPAPVDGSYNYFNLVYATPGFAYNASSCVGGKQGVQQRRGTPRDADDEASESASNHEMSATLTPLAPRRNGALDRGEARAARSWSTRRTVAFVVAVCGAFWLAIGAAVYWLISLF